MHKKFHKLQYRCRYIDIEKMEFWTTLTRLNVAGCCIATEEKHVKNFDNFIFLQPSKIISTQLLGRKKNCFWNHVICIKWYLFHIRKFSNKEGRHFKTSFKKIVEIPEGASRLLLNAHAKRRPLSSIWKVCSHDTKLKTGKNGPEIEIFLGWRVDGRGLKGLNFWKTHLEHPLNPHVKEQPLESILRVVGVTQDFSRSKKW